MVKLEKLASLEGCRYKLEFEKDSWDNGSNNKRDSNEGSFGFREMDAAARTDLNTIRRL